jgi:tetratricopeptide (TPR) repeat protein
MVKIHFYFIFLIFITFGLSSKGQEIETINKYRRFKLAEEYYEKGMKCYEQERLTDAIENFETSLRLDPNNYLAYFFLGSSFEKTDDLNKALLNYNLTLALKPDFSEGLFNRATLHYRMNQYEKAIEDFTYLLELPESETQAIYFRGIQYGEKDSDTGFDQLLTMSTRDGDIHNYLGHCYGKLKKPDRSVFHFSKALEIDPDQDLCYVNRGLIYLEMGIKDSAKLDFQKALKINPDNSLASYNLSIMDPQDDQISLEQMNQLINKNPNLPFAFANRAYYHYQQGKYPLAILDYDSAIFLDDDNHIYYLERGMCYEKMGRLEETFRNYKKATLLQPADPDVWFNLGNVYYKKEIYQKAIEAYTTSIDLDNTRGSGYFNRGLAFYKLGETEKACVDMKQALTYQVEAAQNFLLKNCHP